MKNVIFLGCVVPPKLRYFDRRAKLNCNQSYLFSDNVLSALSVFTRSVFCVSVHPIPYFWVSGVYFTGAAFLKYHGLFLGLLPTVNFPVVKELIRFFGGVLCSLWIIFFRAGRGGWVFIHGLNSPFILVGFLLRLFGYKICVILTDSPGGPLKGEPRVLSWLRLLNKWFIGSVTRHADAGLALTHSLANTFIPGLPVLVFPGFSNVDKFLSLPNVDLNIKDEMIVCYAGSLQAQYGVINIIKIVGEIKSAKIRLLVCGGGEGVEDVSTLSSRYTNVDYLGMLGEEDLLDLYGSVNVFVNPRPNGFTDINNSFPSKLMEYLATGRPVISTPLPWVPEDILNTIKFTATDDPDDIKSAILDVHDNYAAYASDEMVLRRIRVAQDYSPASIGGKISIFLDGGVSDV
jgi:glycosyltransferase involved in cell wall biosynthesis